MGRKCVFSKEEEADIVQHCIHLSRMFYGLTPTDLRKLIYEYAVTNEISNPFDKEKKIAGKDWFQAFKRRHPQLTLRKPEATSLGRINGFNEESIKIFFNNVEKVFEKHNFPPHRIYNVDETGITTVQIPTKIIAEKGVKQLGKAVSYERGRNITVCCAVSASGSYVPPMFIYPRARMSEQLKRNGPLGAIYECSTKGWMNEQLFLVWLNHFQSYTSCSKENSVLLLLDNHGSHCSLAAYEFCRENGIIMLSFPPHTSHRLQPLDLTIFGPLKTAYSNECSIFMRQHPHQKITPYDVAEIFNHAYVRIAAIEKAQKGFAMCGVVPFNPNIFSQEDFAPSILSTPSEPINQTEAELNSADGTVSQPSKEQPDVSTNFLDAGTSSLNSSVSHTNKDKRVSFKDISPLCSNANVQQKPRKLGISKILTATPEKENLEEREHKRNAKKGKFLINKPTIIKRGRKNETKQPKKKQKEKNETENVSRKLQKVDKVKKRVFDDESSSASDRSLTETDLCDNDSLDDLNLEDWTEDEVCMVCGEFGKTETWFRCGLCKKWAHKECTGFDSHVEFICDFCQP